jgi:hypothetical protein
MTQGRVEVIASVERWRRWSAAEKVRMVEETFEPGGKLGGSPTWRCPEPIDELQHDLHAWIKEYNEARPHQGRWCFGKTPMQTFLDAMPMTKEKMIAA